MRNSGAIVRAWSRQTTHRSQSPISATVVVFADEAVPLLRHIRVCILEAELKWQLCVTAGALSFRAVVATGLCSSGTADKKDKNTKPILKQTNNGIP